MPHPIWLEQNIFPDYFFGGQHRLSYILNDFTESSPILVDVGQGLDAPVIWIKNRADVNKRSHLFCPF